MVITGTKESLEVQVNTENRLIKMSGVSMPESPLEFFVPIFEEIEEKLMCSNEPVSVEMKIHYLNSVSYKQIIKMFKMLSDKGIQTNVKWSYSSKDILIKDMGEQINQICPEVNLTVDLLDQ